MTIIIRGWIASLRSQGRRAMRPVFLASAWDDYLHWQATDPNCSRGATASSRNARVRRFREPAIRASARRAVRLVVAASHAGASARYRVEGDDPLIAQCRCHYQGCEA